MAGVQEDFLYGDDLEAVLAIIDGDFLQNDDEFNAEVDAAVNNIPSIQESPKFSCLFCEKLCVSKGGLTRHVNSKHADRPQETRVEATKKKVAEEVLHPLKFKVYLEKSAAKLAEDECYPDNILDELKKFSISSVDDVMPAYSLIKPSLISFDGDAEKLFPALYKVFSEHDDGLYKSLSRNCCNLLSFEVSNHVLAHLAGATFKEDVLTFHHDETTFLTRRNQSFRTSVVMFLVPFIAGSGFLNLTKIFTNSSACHFFLPEDLLMKTLSK